MAFRPDPAKVGAAPICTVLLDVLKFCPWATNEISAPGLRVRLEIKSDKFELDAVLAEVSMTLCVLAASVIGPRSSEIDWPGSPMRLNVPPANVTGALALNRPPIGPWLLSSTSVLPALRLMAA